MLALSVIVLGRLIRSHIPAIVLNALIRVRSELLIVLRLVYLISIKEEKNFLQEIFKVNKV